MGRGGGRGPLIVTLYPDVDGLSPYMLRVMYGYLYIWTPCQCKYVENRTCAPLPSPGLVQIGPTMTKKLKTKSTKQTQNRQSDSYSGFTIESWKQVLHTRILILNVVNSDP